MTSPSGMGSGSRGPSIGKGCLWGFGKLAELDEKVLVALIDETAKMGLVAEF
jgi:hypothetical protein